MENKKIRALFIGAHPDDCEICGGGLALKLAKAGHTVKFCSVTDGRGGTYRPERMGDFLKEHRRGEMRNVAELVGCETEMLDNHDTELAPDAKTREGLIRMIRKFNPDIIFTHRSCDYHPDHHYTSTLVTDAAYMLKVPYVCPDVPAMRKFPTIIFYQDPFTKPYPMDPTFIINIDDVWEDKFKAMMMNECQFFDWLEWVDCYTDDPDSLTYEQKLEFAKNKIVPKHYEAAHKWRDMLVSQYGDAGKKVVHAEAYEVSEHGGILLPEIKELLLSL